MNEPVLLRLDNVEVTYHRVATAVQGVSLDVREGTIVALLGTNGAGKTTTLRAISGFIGLDDARVTDGSIAHQGERIDNRPPHEITARGITLVPERSKVFEITRSTSACAASCRGSVSSSLHLAASAGARTTTLLSVASAPDTASARPNERKATSGSVFAMRSGGTISRVSARTGILTAPVAPESATALRSSAICSAVA